MPTTQALVKGRPIDPQNYRRVLGQFPTGVCLVTADDPETGRCGMVVGSFTSVSMDPPLVAFFPAKTSTSWPKIQRAGSFCVNILGADQEDVCRAFFASTAEKFAGLSTTPTPSGAPVVDGVVAWIDCSIETVQDAGDHYYVLGRVSTLEVATSDLPLVFFQGGYGKFSPLSLSAPDVHGVLTGTLRQVDLARPLMERFAADFDCRCIASARIDDEVIVVASAGEPQDSQQSTLVGQRMPYAPPMGSAFAAWDPDDEVTRWLRISSDPFERKRHEEALSIVRRRGMSIALLTPAQREFASRLQDLASDGPEPPESDLDRLIPQMSYDPPDLDEETRHAIRQVSAPVFKADGGVAFALTAYGFGRPRKGIDALTAGLLDMAAVATRRIGGRLPEASR